MTSAIPPGTNVASSYEPTESSFRPYGITEKTKAFFRKISDLALQIFENLKSFFMNFFGKANNTDIQPDQKDPEENILSDHEEYTDIHSDVPSPDIKALREQSMSGSIEEWSNDSESETN